MIFLIENNYYILKMESLSPKAMLVNLPLLSIILPYFGFSDQCHRLMNILCSHTCDFWNLNKRVFKLNMYVIGIPQNKNILIGDEEISRVLNDYIVDLNIESEEMLIKFVRLTAPNKLQGCEIYRLQVDKIKLYYGDNSENDEEDALMILLYVLINHGANISNLSVQWSNMSFIYKRLKRRTIRNTNYISHICGLKANALKIQKYLCDNIQCAWFNECEENTDIFFKLYKPNNPIRSLHVVKMYQFSNFFNCFRELGKKILENFNLNSIKIYAIKIHIYWRIYFKEVIEYIRKNQNDHIQDDKSPKFSIEIKKFSSSESTKILFKDCYIYVKSDLQVTPSVELYDVYFMNILEIKVELSNFKPKCHSMRYLNDDCYPSSFVKHKYGMMICQLSSILFENISKVASGIKINKVMRLTETDAFLTTDSVYYTETFPSIRNLLYLFKYSVNNLKLEIINPKSAIDMLCLCDTYRKNCGPKYELIIDTVTLDALMTYNWKSKIFTDLIKGKLTHITGHFACDSKQIEFLYKLIQMSEDIPTNFDDEADQSSYILSYLKTLRLVVSEENLKAIKRLSKIILPIKSFRRDKNLYMVF